MNKLILPSTHTAAYSDIPLMISSTFSNKDNFKYIINICYNDYTIYGISTTQYRHTIVSKITIPGNTFKIGDKLFLFDNDYNGYYIVLDKSGNDIIIDLTMNKPFQGTGRICNYYNYKLPADPDGNCKVDLSNTIKDFVKSTIKDNHLDENMIGIYDGSSTRFTYFIVFGEQYKYELKFKDNAFIGGNVAFVNNDYTDLTTVPFMIGDKINVTQDMAEWYYNDNYFDAGNVGFTSSGVHNFQVGDLINVNGQSTYTEYNGIKVVKRVPNNTSLVVDFPFLGNTGAQPGYIYGNPVEQYNGDFTIIDLYIDPILGLVLVTDGHYNESTQPIGGTITYLYDTIVNTLTEDIEDNYGFKYNVFDARIDRKDFRKYGGYDKDLFKDNFTIFEGFGMSTILDSNAMNTYLNKVHKQNNIDLTTKSFILLHSGTSNTDISMKYMWYDKTGTLLGTSYLTSGLSKKDIYVPIGVMQLYYNIDRVDSIGFSLTTSYKNIKSYSVVPYSGVPTNELALPIKYVIECSPGIDDYTLIWKDSMGSFISYGFKHVANEGTDITKTTYYTDEAEYIKTGATWNYDISNVSRGENVISTQARNKFKLTSGWVKDYENYLIEDLYKSTEVYLQLPATDVLTPNELVPVVIETPNVEYGKSVNGQIFSYSPVVRVAYNDYRF